MDPLNTLRDRFWEKPLEELSRAEWEALCDGCGNCCLHKFEDEDTGELLHTNVACKLLDTDKAVCTNYRHRLAFVPDCLRLTPRLAHRVNWLPETCAYKVRARGEALPEWHYLLSGDREAVHRAGVGVAKRVISEVVAGPIEQHIIDPEDEAEDR